MPFTSPPVATEPGIELLRRLYPPQTLIHVGIGQGVGPMHSWQHWSTVKNALLIEADATRIQWAKELVAQQPSWQLVENVSLDQTDGKALYYRASNPDEDGLIDPETLKSLWPNLRNREQAERPVQQLDSLISGLAIGKDIQASSCIWLLIDCLPAGRILRGASQLLQHATLVWARVLLQPIAQDIDDARLNVLEDQLAPLGFRTVQVSETNHPAIGYALLVRDWASQLRDEANKATEEHKARAKQLKADADKQAQLAAARVQELDQSTQKLKQTQAKVDELKAALEQHTQAKMQAEDKIKELNKALDAAHTETQQVAELKKQLEAAKAAAKQQQAQANEQKSELDRDLEAAKSEAEKQKAAAAKYKADSEKQSTQVQQLEAEAEKQAKRVEQHKAEADKQAQLATARAQELDQSTQALKQTQAKVDELKAALEQHTQAKTQAEDKIKELNKALDAAHTETQQIAELKKQLEAAKAAAKQQQAQANEQKSEFDRDLEAAKSEAEKQKAAATKYKADSEKQSTQVQQLEAEAEKQAKRVEQHKAEADKQAKLATERAEQLAQHAEAYAALQRDNAISLRMQSLREADLKDLQQRHAEVVAQKDKQANLLKQLTERLTVASGYLHQLEQHPQQPKEAPTESNIDPQEQHKSFSIQPGLSSMSQSLQRLWPFGKAQ